MRKNNKNEYDLYKEFLEFENTQSKLSQNFKNINVWDICRFFFYDSLYCKILDVKSNVPDLKRHIYATNSYINDRLIDINKMAQVPGS